jgi:hypothetical protein
MHLELTSLVILVRVSPRNEGTTNPTKDGWNRESHEMKRDSFGVFEISLPAVKGQPAISHDSKIKVGIET